MRRLEFYLAVVIPFLTASIVALLSVPSWSKYLEENYPNLHNLLSIAAFICGILTFIFTVLLPLRWRLKRKIYNTIEKNLLLMSNSYGGIKFSANIMRVRTSYFVMREPQENDKSKTKFQFRQRIFWVEQEFGADKIPRKFRLTTNQGVCGEAYRSEASSDEPKVISAIFADGYNQDKDMNFTTQQIEATKDLFTVSSCPLIMQKKRGGISVPTTIGVLNIQSKEEKSVHLLTDVNNAKNRFHNSIIALANIYVELSS